MSMRIDGELVTASEGETILEVARANGKEIPTLCYLKGLSAVGACRVCVVELTGTGRLLPACSTPVQEGMSIRTQSAKLRFTGAWQWNCCWPSATMSARRA